MKTGISLLALGTALSAVAAPSAFAQQSGDDPFARHRFTAVLERAQPQFDPQPLHAGAFDLSSSLGLGAAYNDNIFAQKNNQVSDGILSVKPQIDARSNWTSNELSGGVAVDNEDYLDHTKESFTDYNGYLHGRVDATRALWFGAQLAGGSYTEPRYSPSSEELTSGAPDKPVHYDQFNGELQTSYRFSRIRIDAQAGATKNDYHDARNGAGVTIDEDFRDETTDYVNGRASYAVSPDVAVYLQGKYQDLNYDNPPPAGTTNRDAKQTYVQVGANFELAAPFRGDIAVGYVDENKSATGVKDTDGLSFDGRLQWLPTEIITVTLTGHRSVFDPGLLESSSAFDTSGDLHVDYELRRNIVLFADAGYELQDYQQTDAAIPFDRSDKITTVALGAGYKLNRHARLDFSYSLRSQSSSGAQHGTGFDQNIVGVALKLYP